MIREAHLRLGQERKKAITLIKKWGVASPKDLATPQVFAGFT